MVIMSALLFTLRVKSAMKRLIRRLIILLGLLGCFGFLIDIAVSERHTALWFILCIASIAGIVQITLVWISDTKKKSTKESQKRGT